MTESVEWERLGDHEEGAAEATASSATKQARALLASSRNRTRFGRVFVEHLLAECNAAVERADLAEAQVAEITAERTGWQRRANRGHVVAEVLRADLLAANKRADAAERELAEVRAEAADPFNPQRIAEAVKRARRQRDEAVEAIAAERDEYVEELARLREQLQSATVLPERWRDVLAERDAARRELAEVRELVGNPRYQWASSAPGFFFGPPLLDEAHVRRLVSEINAGGGQAVLKRRLVGDWMEVDDA